MMNLQYWIGTLIFWIFFTGGMSGSLQAVDWDNWRGPFRDGRSPESGLPDSWSPEGENLSWKAPYGGRSGPIVVGDQLYLLNGVSEGKTLQERLMCFNADTGEVIWERTFNIYHSDVPPHRVAWAAPVGDPETGNVYVFGVGGPLLAYAANGDLLWERSLSEEFGLVTTHGGRTVSPVLIGDLVIVSGLNAGWGDQARGAHRFFAFHRRTGELVWVSSPGERPYDTTYSPPIITVIDGTPLLIGGAGDGAVHALKVGTGEPVWRWEISKRGINTGPLVHNDTVYVSHSEENLDTNVMGLIAAADVNARGEIGPQQIRWQTTGFTGGFSSPVIDQDQLYQIDNSANLVAWDLEDGERLWTLNLGTIQRASPVLADGKLYVGTENGVFYILKPERDRCEILHQVQLGTESVPERIVGSVAVSKGRIFLVTSANLYAIGKKQETNVRVDRTGTGLPEELRSQESQPASMLVVPAEVLLHPGESAQFQVRLFDEKGRFIREEPAAKWDLERLHGEVSTDGTFKASGESPLGEAGLVKATVDGITGSARVRVIPQLPWKWSFQDFPAGPPPANWINATGKFAVRDQDDRRVLVKLDDNPFTKRARVFIGPSDWSNYTVTADVRAVQRRRQMGDAGVVGQRYTLLLFGNHQRLELQPWQPETDRTVSIPFTWKPDTWYRLKLHVVNEADGQVRIFAKAWPVEDPEPEGWLIDHRDPVPNRQGSPGIYADAHNEVYFANLEVTPNP